MKKEYKELKSYLKLWGTQSLSALGSGMTSYGLVLWLYLQSGSALQTAFLSICSYTPYVVMSIFAGALSDRWNKKRTMLICDSIAAFSTVIVLALMRAEALSVWHLYFLNALNGLMNTVQQPASEVAATLLIPKKRYHKTSSLRSFSQSLNSVLTPILATVLFSAGGIELVIAVDLATFAAAFFILWLRIPIPEPGHSGKKSESLAVSARKGLVWLKRNPLILNLILFLASINLIASAYSAVLPALILPKASNGEALLGIVNGCAGAAALCGSIFTALFPAPKNRVRVICASLFLSMSTENFMLAFGNHPLVWCAGAVLGWLMIPFMNTNMDVIFRSTIPSNMQGRVYACRNTLQFFTIPAGYLLGGFLVDNVFEPLMAVQPADCLLVRLFGSGKGSGAAMLFFILGVAGVMVCFFFRLILSKYKWNESI